MQSDMSRRTASVPRVPMLLLKNMAAQVLRVIPGIDRLLVLVLRNRASCSVKQAGGPTHRLSRRP